MSGTIRDKLNPLYQRLFGAPVFDRNAVEEPRATCDSCAMCDQGQLAPVEMGYFKPNLKCCTWHPALLNFLVGAIFSDPDPALEEGRQRLRAMIATRKGVSAIAMTATAKYALLYSAGGRGFGRADSLLCPYYSQERGGSCTVWRYRESVCSTYFCKYENGKPGLHFWTAMKGYLAHTEAMLGSLAAFAVDPTLPILTRDPKSLTLEELEDKPPTDALYASYWGRWVGREEEFYRACYDYVRNLTPEEFKAKVDDHKNGRGALGQLSHRLDVIENRTVLPERLVRAADLKTRPAGDNVVVTSYNPFDAFAVDRELFDVLAKLDGKQTLAQNLERLETEEGVELQPDLLQYLFTHGVIEEPPPPPPAATVEAANVTSPKDANKDKARRRKRR